MNKLLVVLCGLSMVSVGCGGQVDGEVERSSSANTDQSSSGGDTTDSGSSDDDSDTDARSASSPCTHDDIDFTPARISYVATTGDDSNDGTIDSPWRTIQHAADSASAGVDIVIRGGTYYEQQIRLAHGGSASAPVTFCAYPDEHPILDFGLVTKNGWAVYSGSGAKRIYRADPTYATHHQPQNTLDVIVAQKVLIPLNCPSRTVAACGAKLTPGTFFWSSASSDYGAIYAYPPDSLDMTSAEVTILNFDGSASGSPTGIQTFDPAHTDVVGANIVLDGLSMRGGQRGVWVTDPTGKQQHSGMVIRNSEIAFSYSYAVHYANWDGARVENCSVHDNGLNNWPHGSANWPTVIIGWSATNITVTESDIHDNHGEGVGPYFGCAKWSITNNRVYDNYSTNIYDDADGLGTGGGDILIDGNLIYNTGKYIGANVTNPTDYRDMADGIRIANEHADGMQSTYHLDPSQNHVTVTNNIIVNVGQFGIGVVNYLKGPFYLQNSVIANNTIAKTYNGAPAIAVQSAENVLVANNLSLHDMISVVGLPTSHAGSHGVGVIATNNSVPSAAEFHASGGTYPSHVSGTLVGTPQICSTTAPYVALSYAPVAGSAVLDAGVAVSNAAWSHDYLGTARAGDTCTIGAIEAAVSSTTCGD